MSSYSQETEAKLRVAVATISREVAQAPPSPALAAAWAELVSLLALGPQPETRECPKCHSTGMRAASRCGNCWTALAPLPASPAVQS